MKILHTSDWHLGKLLYNQDRHEEHQLFFKWLLQTINQEKIDILLVAGDIFDNATPSNEARSLYYNFLADLKSTHCKHIIITGGNHDSPSFLNAPKEILAALNITVVGNATEDINDEIIVINDTSNKPASIICAVPFLRERDISRFVEGETFADREERIAKSVAKHYSSIAEKALSIQQELGVKIPIIAMGHLSVVGGKRQDDDGVRDTYIGSIGAVSSAIFPEVFEYVALGHYHIPSKIKNNIYYSGSPLPMSFSEEGQQKTAVILDLSSDIKITTTHIPQFKKLVSVKGDKKNLENQIIALKETNEETWIEVVYTDSTTPFNGNFSQWVDELVNDSTLKVLRKEDLYKTQEILALTQVDKRLQQLNPTTVFEELLKEKNISEEERKELLPLYNQVVQEISEKE